MPLIKENILQEVLKVCPHSMEELRSFSELAACLADHDHPWSEDLPVLQLHHLRERVPAETQAAAGGEGPSPICALPAPGALWGLRLGELSCAFQVDMIRVPLKEEEVYRLFGDSRDASRAGKICLCFCNCDELEPPPRVRNFFFSAFFSKLYEVHEQ